MREIKFRIWHKKSKTMYYPNDENEFMLLLGDSGFYQVQNHDNFDIKTAKYKDLRIVDSLEDNLQIMQFTGLKDKNGIDIYEGDFYRSYGGTYTIIFKEGAFCAYLKNEKDATPLNWECDKPDNFSNEIEIIGNIHEQ